MQPSIGWLRNGLATLGSSPLQGRAFWHQLCSCLVATTTPATLCTGGKSMVGGRAVLRCAVLGLALYCMALCYGILRYAVCFVLLVLCCALLCCAVLCCAVLCCAVLCCAVLCPAGPCWAVLGRAMPCCAALRCAALCCAVLRCASPLRFIHSSLQSTLQMQMHTTQLPVVPSSCRWHLGRESDTRQAPAGTVGHPDPS